MGVYRKKEQWLQAVQNTVGTCLSVVATTPPPTPLATALSEEKFCDQTKLGATFQHSLVVDSLVVQRL